MKRNHNSKSTLLSLFLLMPVFAAGCSSDSNSPTAPQTSLQVDAFQTSTQIEQGAFRIQVRMRVLRGLATLDQASASGQARLEICDVGGCAQGPLDHSFMEATCAGVPRFDFGTGWLDGDVVGVDFCIPELADGLVFETTVIDGVNRSNIVTTRCAASNVGILCGSQ